MPLYCIILNLYVKQVRQDIKFDIPCFWFIFRELGKYHIPSLKLELYLYDGLPLPQCIFKYQVFVEHLSYSIDIQHMFLYILCIPLNWFYSRKKNFAIKLLAFVCTVCMFYLMYFGHHKIDQSDLFFQPRWNISLCSVIIVFSCAIFYEDNSAIILHSVCK